MKKTKLMFLILAATFTLLQAIGQTVPLDLITDLLPANPVVVEAGAQFGEDTVWMSKLWTEGQIYAFEPSPNTFSSVQKVASEHPNVHCYQLALSQSKGTGKFYLAGGASSLLRPTDSINKDYFHSDLDNPAIVNTITMDEWAQENGVTKVDFLWFDMEGNELNALHGAQGILKNVKLIYTEVNLHKFWEGCVQYDELKQWLELQGFQEIWSEITPHWNGNCLFVNTRI